MLKFITKYYANAFLHQSYDFFKLNKKIFIKKQIIAYNIEA